MNRTSLAILMAFCCPAGVASWAHADIVCPDSSYVTVSFTKTYSGSYGPGQPYDYVTIAPEGAESFADNGVTIRAFLKNCQGQPLAGIPASDVVLQQTLPLRGYFCICPGGNFADAATDQNGTTKFTGALRGGGCTDGLRVMAQGVQIGVVPVKINSPDRISSGGPCQIDSHDQASLQLGAEAGLSGNYGTCADLNEDGHIDLSDLAYLARFRLARCRP